MTALGWFVSLALAGLLVAVWSSRRGDAPASSSGAEPARWLVDDAADGLLVVRGGVVRVANPTAAALLDRSITELEGAGIVDVLGATPGLSDSQRESIAGWATAHVTGRAADPTVTLHVGDHGVVELRALHDPAGSADAPIVVRLRDVAGRSRQDLALDQARRRFRQAFHSAPTGMALVRLDDGRVVDANQSLGEMLAVAPDVLVGRTLREFTHPEDVREAVPLQARLELGIVDSYRVDQRYVRADGVEVWARTRVAAAEDDGVMLAITHIEDITEQRRSAELLTHAARHDELTGLPNRTHLFDVLTERLADAEPGGLGLLFVDVDHFKVVNDGLGHTVGDELLRVLARRLRGAVRGDDLLARFGGDEFVVVVGARGQRVDAHEVAMRLRASLARPIEVGDEELFVTVSIGYALNEGEDTTAHDLLRFADAAMYRAKGRGRDAIEAFDLTDPGAPTVALRTSTELRRGLERGEVVPYFQPIVDLTTGAVLGHEVLARWLHPERGLLAPSEFLALAEETGQMIDLGTVMLRDSLSQLARWRAAGAPIGSGCLHVNIATRQLVDPDFHRHVDEILAETGIDADSLWLEITETSLLADVKATTTALRELRSLGLHLVVDDFGTGYSSLTYLRRFPVEAIKIDRAFVTGLGLEHHDTTIVDAVVQLGQALGLTVVAEGIETPLQLSTLRNLGCDRGQGYLFSRPRPASLIEVERAHAPLV